MSIQSQRYLRKPLYVDAVRVTTDNFEEIAKWCQGEIQRDEIPGEGPGKRHIKVRVHNPKNPRQTKAFVGDWLLYTERGYKVYTSKAFHSAFDLVDGVEKDKATQVEKRGEDNDQIKFASVGTNEEIELLANGGITEIVPATPENIAQAILDNEKAREDLEIPNSQVGLDLDGEPEDSTFGTPRGVRD